MKVCVPPPLSPSLPLSLLSLSLSLCTVVNSELQTVWQQQGEEEEEEAAAEEEEAEEASPLAHVVSSIGNWVCIRLRVSAMRSAV